MGATGLEGSGRATTCPRTRGAARTTFGTRQVARTAPGGVDGAGTDATGAAAAAAGATRPQGGDLLAHVATSHCASAAFRCYRVSGLCLLATVVSVPLVLVSARWTLLEEVLRSASHKLPRHAPRVGAAGAAAAGLESPRVGAGAPATVARRGACEADVPRPSKRLAVPPPPLVRMRAT